MDDPNIDGYETYCIGKIDAYCKELEAKLKVAVEALENCRLWFDEGRMGFLNRELHEALSKIKSEGL